MECEGLESRRTLPEWQQTYRQYVPLRGADMSKDEYGRTSLGVKGLLTRDPKPLDALGHYSPVGDILTNIIDPTQLTIISAENNPVTKTFLRFAARGRSPLYKFGLAEKRCRPNRVTGMVETIWVTTDVDHDSVFAAKVGGKPYYIVIEHSGSLRSSRLSEQTFRVDKWSLCRG